MRLSVIFCLFLGGIYFSSVASAGYVQKYTVRVVKNDEGGSLSTYITKYARMEANREFLKIDGPCMSACTLFPKLIDHERVCVTDRASMTFHAAGYRDPETGGSLLDHNGERVISQSGTQLMRDFYTQEINDWIDRHGGLTNNLIRLKGKELQAMFKRC